MGAMLIVGIAPKKGPKHMNPMEKFLSKGADKEPLMEDEMSSEKTGKISFSLPSGFKVPDGVKDGEPFDAMATLTVKDGKLVLGELDGSPVGDESVEPMEATEEPKSEDLSEDLDEEPAAAPEEPEKEADSEYADEEESDEPEDDSLGFLDRIEKKVQKRKKE